MMGRPNEVHGQRRFLLMLIRDKISLNFLPNFYDSETSIKDATPPGFVHSTDI